MQHAEEKLTPKQEKALVALLDRAEVRAAAREAGVNEATLWRWLQDAEFQRRYRAARAQMVETAVATMQRACTLAVSTLVNVMGDENAPASSRVSAARAVIEQSLSAIQLTDLQAEVEEIKRMLAEQEGRKGLREARA